MSWVNVCKTTDIECGKLKVVDLDGTDVIIFNVDNEFYALEDNCTHDNSEISSGKIEGKCIVCPRHGAKFDITNGAVLSAPAYEDIEKFELKVEGDDIYIIDHRW